MNALVIAHYQEDTGWTRDVPEGWRAFVISKDRHLPNDGTAREAGTYLWWIATHHETIDPDATYAFVQGQPFDHGFTLEMLREVDRFASLSAGSLDEDHEGRPNHPGLPVGIRAQEWLGLRQDRFVAPYGAQFMVPGALLLSYPQAFYDDLYRKVCADKDGAWIMERLWPALWPSAVGARSVPLSPSGEPAWRQADLLRAVHGRVSPYEGFRPGPKDLQGWNGDDPRLAQIASLIGARTIVEVGTWKGLSAVAFAEGVTKRGGGVVVCVDTWLGAREFIGATEATRDLRLLHGYPQVYYSFLSNVVALGHQEVIVPFPQTGSIAARFLRDRSFQADLVYLDASHDREDVEIDLRDWWPVVRAGGILCGDDIDHHWPGVAQAVHAWAEGHSPRLRIETSGPFWWTAKG